MFVRGFAHESALSPFRFDPPRLWPGAADDVPDVLACYLTEPAFNGDGAQNATVCMWRERADGRWHSGTVNHPAETRDPDGAD